jgi:hypothetical protein
MKLLLLTLAALPLAAPATATPPAESEPASLGFGVTVPATWRELPELLRPPGSADAAIRVVIRRAHGDPALGCFSLLQRISAPAKTDLPAALAAVLPALTGHGFDVALEGAVTGFTGNGVRGRIAVASAPGGRGRIAVLSAACFYNDRAPDRCRPACDALLASFAVNE